MANTTNTAKATKRHSATYNSIRKNIRNAHPEWSEKAVNIRTIYACRKHDAEMKARKDAKEAAPVEA